MTAELAGLGHVEAVLWVVPQNDRARRFYESEAWRDDHVRREDEVFGVVVPEMRYRRLRLVRRCQMPRSTVMRPLFSASTRAS